MSKKFTPLSRNVRLIVQLLLIIAFLAMAFVARSQATVQTDQPDYAPGSTAFISGSGWLPGEGVVLQVLHPGDSIDNTSSPSGAHLPWTVLADELGNISSQWDVPTDEDELGATLLLSAKGVQSGSSAEWIFTDANTKFIVAGLPSGVSVTVNFGSTSAMSQSVTFTSGGNNASSQFVYTGTMYFAFPATLSDGTTTWVLTGTDKTSPATVAATGAFSVTGTYEVQGGSGGLTITAPACAEGVSFTITYTPAQGGQPVTETRTTPYSFTAKKNTTYSITSIQNYNGNTYTGPSTVSGTTPNLNDFQTTVLLSFSDTQPPFLSVPAPVVTGTDYGLCSARVTTPAVTYGDNCSGFALAWVMGGATSGSGTGQVGTYNYAVGQTAITYVVRDAAGNAASAVAYITVSDTEPPMLVPPADIQAPTGFGQCSASIPDLGMPSVQDNCGLVTFTSEPSGPFPLGITQVKWTATDQAGNTTIAYQQVAVYDTEPPRLVAPPALVVSADPGKCSVSAVILGVAMATDNCILGPVTSNAPPVFPLGLTSVVWSVSDQSGNQATAVQLVTVIDMEPPVLKVPLDIVISTDPGQCSATGVDLGLPEASDNCSLNSVTNDAPVTFLLGSTSVKWVATDQSGNTTVATQIVKVVDREFPVITLPANMVISTCEPVPAWKGKVTDNCSANIFGPFYSPDNTFAPGTTTTISYYALDEAGNRADNYFTITRAAAILASAVVTTPVVCNGGMAVITVSASGGIPPYTGTGTFSKPAGSYSFIVTDAAGCTANAAVTVTEPPAVVSTFATNNSYLYFGYSGDQSAQITARPSGGVGPYTVRMTMNRSLLCNMITSSGDETWSASAGGSSSNHVCPSSGSLAGFPSVEWSSIAAGATVTLNVTLMQDAKFTLVVTDSKGCVYTTSTLTGGGPNGGVDAEDVRCFTNSLVQKVQICHRTGNAKNPCVTICVDESAVAEHIAHGDYYGKCNNTCTAPVANARVVEDGETGTGEPFMSVYPNPFSSDLTVEVVNPTGEMVSIQVYDMAGKNLNINQIPSENKDKYILHTEELPAGIHVLRVTFGKATRAVRIMKQ